MSHAHATPTPTPAPLRLARLVVDGGWTYPAAATMFMVCPRKAKRWTERLWLEGTAGMWGTGSNPPPHPWV